MSSRVAIHVRMGLSPFQPSAESRVGCRAANLIHSALAWKTRQNVQSNICDAPPEHRSISRSQVGVFGDPLLVFSLHAIVSAARLWYMYVTTGLWIVVSLLTFVIKHYKSIIRPLSLRAGSLHWHYYLAVVFLNDHDVCCMRELALPEQQLQSEEQLKLPVGTARHCGHCGSGAARSYGRALFSAKRQRW